MRLTGTPRSHKRTGITVSLLCSDSKRYFASSEKPHSVCIRTVCCVCASAGNAVHRPPSDFLIASGAHQLTTANGNPVAAENIIVGPIEFVGLCAAKGVNASEECLSARAWSAHPPTQLDPGVGIAKGPPRHSNCLASMPSQISAAVLGSKFSFIRESSDGARGSTAGVTKSYCSKSFRSSWRFIAP
jgi:hypothetical protein